jgi:hypothetical protein
MSHMEGAGRIRRYEFDEDAPACTQPGMPIARILCQNPPEFGVISGRMQEEIDESRARYLHSGNRFVGRQRGQQGGCKLPRVLAGGLRQLHRDVGGKIPMLWIPRKVDLDLEISHGRR